MNILLHMYGRKFLGMSRERIIKTAASPSGRQCPKNNIQRKPCPPVPCYKWIAGPWSHCQLHVSYIRIL